MHIFCLIGPTASGKTALAIQLIQRFPFEIISVDSAMIYRGMNIGTAKPTPDLLKIAPHHLIDIRDPKDIYSVAEFIEDAHRAIQAIFSRGKIPLVVGGTMLYVQALQKGLADLPKADLKIRAELTMDAARLGWPALHARLMLVDPIAAGRIHPNDGQRIQRALEVHRIMGVPLSELQAQPSIEPREHFHNIVIAPLERSILHARIAERFEQMLASGFIDEVKALYQRGDLSLELPSMRSVGYHEIGQYLQGHLTYAQMLEKSIIASRQLAKHQLTWLKRMPNATWFDSDAVDLLQQIISFLKKFDLSEAY